MPIDYTFLNKLVEDIKSFGFTITSTTGGKHNTGSKHSKGKAVDVRTSDKTEQQCIAFISAMKAKGYKVLDERTRPVNKNGQLQAVWSGPHIHVEELLSINLPSINDEHYSNGEATNDYLNKETDSILVNNVKDTTAVDFIEKYNIKMTAVELLSYSDNSGQIFKSYNQKQKSLYKQPTPLLIGLGARLTVPMKKITAPKSIYTINQTIIANREYNCFIETEIKKLLNDPNYKKINVDNSETNSLVGTVFKRVNNCSVWIWSKATDFKTGSHLIDITPFVIDVNTNVGENGGNFSINLPHIGYKINAKGDIELPIDRIRADNYDSYVAKTSSHSLLNLSEKTIYGDFKDDNDELKTNPFFYKRENSFFHHIFQKNDIVFIRFEKLGTDKKFEQDKSQDFLKVNSADLPNNSYDMIGMVDNVGINSIAAGNVQQISITGRDLSKLVIDDGVFFFPVEFAVRDGEQIIKNSTKTRSGKRLIMPSTTSKNTTINVGGLQGDTQFNFDKTQSIEEWMTFIFSQLANIDVCPDNLFSAYPDKSFIVSREDSPKANGDFQYKRIKANGIWQIVKLVIDKEVGDRRIADSSLSTDTGSLLNLMRKVCQKPFIELFMDTYGDKFYFIVRKPPFSYKSFISNSCINIFESDITADRLDFDDEVYSWYRLEAMGSFIEQGDGAEMINLPAVMFPEYVEIFGSKVLHVQSNYLDFDQSVSDLSESNITLIRKQSREDLDWLIETHAYLPFSRKGTITLKGDKRIKKGTNIRMFGTGEIYHVDNVSNSGSYSEQQDRTTVLQVSHGLVEKYLPNYFKLIDIQHGTENSWKVNQDIFKFFIQRKQFL